MKKINQQNKICIYLDQFVVSNFVDETNDLWKEIKKKLEIAHSKNKIYCPLSTQHFLETAKKDFNNAIIHHEYFRKLSDNYQFKNELFLTTQLISSLIRANKHTLKTFLNTDKLKKFEEIYNEINEQNKIFNESVNYKTSSQNEFRKVINNNCDKKTEEQFLNVIKSLEVENFIKRLEEYLLKKRIIIRPDNYGKHEFPNWIDQILFQLTYKHKFKETELIQFLNELKTNGFKRIPTLNIRFFLGAYLSVKNKQENTGDHIDIMRISNCLVSSDIFFTDKKRKFEILELKLDKEYDVKVFSGTEKDLLEFKFLLENII